MRPTPMTRPRSVAVNSPSGNAASYSLWTRVASVPRGSLT